MARLVLTNSTPLWRRKLLHNVHTHTPSSFLYSHVHSIFFTLSEIVLGESTIAPCSASMHVTIIPSSWLLDIDTQRKLDQLIWNYLVDEQYDYSDNSILTEALLILLHCHIHPTCNVSILSFLLSPIYLNLYTSIYLYISIYTSIDGSLPLYVPPPNSLLSHSWRERLSPFHRVLFYLFQKSNIWHFLTEPIVFMIIMQNRRCKRSIKLPLCLLLHKQYPTFIKNFQKKCFIEYFVSTNCSMRWKTIINH